MTSHEKHLEERLNHCAAPLASASQPTHNLLRRGMSVLLPDAAVFAGASVSCQGRLSRRATQPMQCTLSRLQLWSDDARLGSVSTDFDLEHERNGPLGEREGAVCVPRNREASWHTSQSHYQDYGRDVSSNNAGCKCGASLECR
jgi:hypothetical protein